MKKERILKPDGRYLLFYSFDAEELSPPGGRKRPDVARSPRRAKPQLKRRRRRRGKER